ncbi:probable pectinesterase 66 [Pistacia vera]|uniref:probable pectinesterase 66 n=1 Tax=Pistacia vera TaxID=55513 RepID=UPI001262E3FD|nr:probable pectinesterase 66 [Pistacia vera]
MKRLQRLSLFVMLLLYSSNACIALDCKLNEQASSHKVAYTITVSLSGRENFTKIQKAIEFVTSGNIHWIRIQIYPGIYKEKVTIPVEKSCIFLQGAGNKLTRIEWGDHESTDTSATFTSFPNNIVAEGITFKNTYNVPSLSIENTPIKQAVAARIYGDKSAFYRCVFVGLQDTLWDSTGRHYFYQCHIGGAIDFIFGNGQSMYEKCVINVTVGIWSRIGYGYIIAQGRNSSSDPSGFVFKACVFTGSGKAYLGRAYGEYSRVIIINSMLSDVVIPEGWDAWSYVSHEENIEYVEAGCRGAGADTSKRVPWEKKPSAVNMSQFETISYVDQDGWIAKSPEN